jgi:LysM repeat protein
VQYGQTLWSIAITYHTTIKQIQSLNHLSTISIIDGQKLLVIKGATQPAPTSNKVETSHTPTTLVKPAIQFQSPMYQRQTPTPPKEYSAQDYKANALSFGAIVIAALFLGGLFTAMSRKRQY